MRKVLFITLMLLSSCGGGGSQQGTLSIQGPGDLIIVEGIYYGYWESYTMPDKSIRYEVTIEGSGNDTGEWGENIIEVHFTKN